MKRGITLSIVLIAIVIMITLITTASVVGAGAIGTANFESFKSNVTRTADAVNEYYLKNEILPTTNEIIAADSVSNELRQLLAEKGDINAKLYVVDMSKLNDSTIENGKGTLKDKDVYFIAENSLNVYYLKGYKYRANRYFSY
ncbi:MAG: type II secretion system protein [Clostridia bacterium]|nr:type II secretion system protein [Clostridia bacterium]